MDRRLNADFYTFISPVVDLRAYLEEAYATKEKVDDFFLVTARDPSATTKAEDRSFDMKKDFAAIANCKPWTANKIFDGDLQPTRFLACPQQRTYEEINGIHNIPPNPKLRVQK
ncbi:unnamed protein product [Cylicostephanus goldi]|uniref:Uncharacterized protein n=1 Tax=Cylicostephanus goldi TaxID=71465 RepID=A0A3P6U6H4_CYLGO|nr:unnamed protein product [Cylicostephanus goldi]